MDSSKLADVMVSAFAAKKDPNKPFIDSAADSARTSSALEAAELSGVVDDALERKLAALTKRGVKPGDAEWQKALSRADQWHDIVMALARGKNR